MRNFCFWRYLFRTFRRTYAKNQKGAETDTLQCSGRSPFKISWPLWSFGFLGILLLGVAYVHGIWLPGKGINGLTGEPKRKYYELKGWTKFLHETQAGDEGEASSKIRRT